MKYNYLILNSVLKHITIKWQLLFWNIRTFTTQSFYSTQSDLAKIETELVVELKWNEWEEIFRINEESYEGNVYFILKQALSLEEFQHGT